MKQLDLARYMNVDASYISKIESGNRNPTLEHIYSIGSILEVCPKQLITCNLGMCHHCYANNYTSRRNDVFTDKTYKSIINLGDDMIGKRVTIYLDSKLVIEAKKKALDEDTSLSAIIGKLLIEYLSKKKDS